MAKNIFQNERVQPEYEWQSFESRKDSLYNGWNPTWKNVIDFAHNYRGDIGDKTPLVGEESSYLTIFVGYSLARQSMLIHSASGTGKSVLMDAVLALMPREQVYTINYGSKKSIFSQEKQINNAEFCVIREVQKALEHLDFREALKTWGEGKDYEYSQTDVTERDEDGKIGKLDYKLLCKPILTSRAVENDDFEVGDELLRRWLQVTTDPSKQQTESIIETQLRDKSEPWDIPQIKNENTARLIEHVRRCIIIGGSMPVAAPGIETIAQFIPKEFPISRSMTNHLLKLVDGTARFSYNNRLNYKGWIVAVPQDVYVITEIFGDSFANNCLRRSEVGKKILSILPDPELRDDGRPRYKKLTIREIGQALSSKHGLVIEQKNLIKEVKELSSIGYVEIDDNMTPHTFFKTGFTDALSNIDWNEYFERCERWAKKNLGSDEQKVFIDKYLKEPITLHPITGEKVNLLDIEIKIKESDIFDDTTAKQTEWFT